MGVTTREMEKQLIQLGHERDCAESEEEKKMIDAQMDDIRYEIENRELAGDDKLR